MTPDAPAAQQPAEGTQPTRTPEGMQTPHTPTGEENSSGGNKLTPEEQQPEELGEGGQATIKAVRAERDKLKAQLRDLQSKQSGEQRPEPVDPEQAANDRVTNHVRTHELRAAAKAERFHDVDDLFTYADPAAVAAIEVEGDEANAEQVAALIAEVLAKRPYLQAPYVADHRAAGVGSLGSSIPKPPSLDDQYGPKR